MWGSRNIRTNLTQFFQIEQKSLALSEALRSLIKVTKYQLIVVAD